MKKPSKLAAAKLLGRIEIEVSYGRMTKTGRFRPIAAIPTIAPLSMHNGKWVVKVNEDFTFPAPLKPMRGSFYPAIRLHSKWHVYKHNDADEVYRSMSTGICPYLSIDLYLEIDSGQFCYS